MCASPYSWRKVGREKEHGGDCNKKTLIRYVVIEFRIDSTVTSFKLDNAKPI